MATLIRQYSRMTFKLQELAIKANFGLLWYLQTVAIVKSEVMVAMRYKNSKNRCYVTFSSGDDPQPTCNRNRKRKVIWYNPPWNANVKTNLGRKFINIINRCFPNEHPVHKIFNKHTLKLSYSCMPDIKSIISSHNKAVLSNFYQSQTQTNDKECNCRKKDQCPLDGKCLTQNVVYQATVTTQTSSDS